MDWDGLDGNLCVGLFYEHRFAMLIRRDLGRWMDSWWLHQASGLRHPGKLGSKSKDTNELFANLFSVSK